MTIEYNAIQWFNYRGTLLPNTPPHHNITLSAQEKKQLLKKSGAYFLRWTTDFDTLQETSFWYIIKDTQEGLETYNSKTRNQIKKGLRLCHVEKITRNVILNEGYEVYRKAFDHYQTVQKQVEQNVFQSALSSLEENWEFWSVRNDSGKLIAYSQNHILDNTCNYSIIKLDPDFLSLYPAYALFFTMNDYYLNTRRMRYVHDGTRSIAHQTNIHNFLCDKFNFRKAYCTLHLAYRPDIAIMVKILYPFRHFIHSISYPLCQKLSVLFKHEEIRRANG